jgi:acetyl-CoA carboxylase biotin carboxylase subunit
VRVDAGVVEGGEVSVYYDPMLAKLIVWGADRHQAIERMHRALLELNVQGVETSREFHLRVMEDAEYRRGDIEIQWLERRLASLVSVAPPADAVRVAAIAAALLADRARTGVARTGGAAPVSSDDAAAPRGGFDAWKEAARREALR